MEGNKNEGIINLEQRISMYGIVNAVERYIMDCAYDYVKGEFILDTINDSRITKVALELLIGMAVDNINNLVIAAIQETKDERPIETDDVLAAQNKIYWK